MVDAIAIVIATVKAAIIKIIDYSVIARYYYFISNFSYILGLINKSHAFVFDTD